MKTRATDADAPIVSERRCSLFELSKERCRWPISTPGAEDFCFCGNPPLDGLPYCTGHTRLAYRPGTRSRGARVSDPFFETSSRLSFRSSTLAQTPRFSEKSVPADQPMRQPTSSR